MLKDIVEARPLERYRIYIRFEVPSLPGCISQGRTRGEEEIVEVAV
jgi:hypothetical protein